MKEFVGKCSCCGKDLYCLDGFLNGVITPEKKIICFICNEKGENKNEDSHR